MSHNWYPASDLIGGTDGCLDAIDGADLAEGDRAIVVADLVYCYVLNATSGVVENSPHVISPDSNAGDKRWELRFVVKENTMFVTSCDGVATSNVIGSTDTNDIIFAGGDNEIDSDGSGGNVILNGTYNIIAGDSEKCVIVTGEDNLIVFGYTDQISGGTYNYIFGLNDAYSSYHNAIVGGESNILESGFVNEEIHKSIMLGGYGNRLIGGVQSAMIGGFENLSIHAPNSVVSGDRAVAHIAGQIAHAGHVIDYWGKKGQVQCSTVLVGCITSGTTPDDFEVFCDDSSYTGPITLKDERFWKVVIEVAATQISGTDGTVGDAAFWDIKTGFKNVGAVDAQGEITITGLPSVGETITVNGFVFTWSDSWSNDPTVILIGATTANCASSLRYKMQMHPLFSNVTASGSVVTLTAQMYQGASANSWGFTTTSANISLDGSGTFGGTTAGADGTVSIVGTAQGTGAPGSNDRDAGAAAWEVDVAADDTAKSLKITATGEADKTIHWTAKVLLTEVAG